MQYPLSDDPDNEDFTAVFNRSPLTVEILSSPEQLLSTSGLQASMVVLLGTGLPTTLTTAVAMGGAKTVKVFDNLGIASGYAADTFRHPMQRVIGGERASVEPTAEATLSPERGIRPDEYVDGLRGKHLLYASENARKMVTACRGAKEVLIGTFANFSAVRRRVLQWWSDVSETDADFIPELNSRVLLVCGSEPDNSSGTFADADRYLAAAFAYQFVQAADVDLPVEGTTREAVAGAVVEAAQGMDAWSTKLQELEQSFLTEGVDTQAVDLMLGFDAVSASLPVYWSHTDEVSEDIRTHTRMPDAMKFDMGGSVNRWANDDHLQRPINSSRPLDTTWGSRNAAPDDTLGDVGAARKRGELPKPRL